MKNGANTGERSIYEVMAKSLHGPHAEPKTRNTTQDFDESQLRWPYFIIIAAATVVVLIQQATRLFLSTAGVALCIFAIFFPLFYAERSSCKGLLTFYEKSKSALAFAGTNMVSKDALNQRLSHFVSVLYGHGVATLTLWAFAYILDRNIRPNLSFSPFCEIVVGALHGLVRNGILSLAAEVRVLRVIIWLGGAILVKLYEEIRNLWTSLLVLKEGNASTDNEADSAVLTKGSLFCVINFLPARPLRCGQLLQIMFLFMMIIAVPYMAAAVTVDNFTGTYSSAGGGVPVGDRLPPQCHCVDNCGDCLPCSPCGQQFSCCDT